MLSRAALDTLGIGGRWARGRAYREPSTHWFSGVASRAGFPELYVLETGEARPWGRPPRS